MGTFTTESVSLHLISIFAKRRLIRKKFKNGKKFGYLRRQVLKVTLEYLQVLFLKIQVLLDTYGSLKQSENENIW